MNDEEFFEFVKHDLKGIESDLIGFLEVYYPMLRSSWNPQNESDFIIGWLLGSKEQEYSAGYYNKLDHFIEFIKKYPFTKTKLKKGLLNI